MAKFDTSKDGVWRTIRGRKVFIAKGQSLKEAMSDSGIKTKGKAKEPIKTGKKLELKTANKKAEMKEAIKRDRKRKEVKANADRTKAEADKHADTLKWAKDYSRARKRDEVRENAEATRREADKHADALKWADKYNSEMSSIRKGPPKTPADYVQGYLDMSKKNAEAIKTFRNWRDIVQGNAIRADLEGDDKKAEDISKMGYNFEDIARSLEGRETTRSMAERLLAEANKHADEVQGDLQNSLKGVAGSVDNGIPFRTKSFDSMRRKLNEKSAEKKMLPEQYAPKVTDALRFTDMVEGDDYVESFNKLKGSLEKLGYEMVEVENSIYKEGKDYRGLNTLVESPRGYVFELQFHTPQSWEIKEENHKDYEVSRRLSTSEEKRELLKDRMKDRSMAVKTPKGAETIKDIERHKRTGPTQEQIEKVMKAKGLSRQDAVRYLKEMKEEKDAPYQSRVIKNRKG